MEQTTVTTRMSEQAGLSSRLAAAAVAALLGSFLILGVGFAHSDTIHNAAHDSRHSFTFPCH
ncbi:MAG: cobalt transporter [Alphaproteobacteria bacterium]|nr:cobalt transporter [Alphaproteobacteria bacterium]